MVMFRKNPVKNRQEMHFNTLKYSDARFIKKRDTQSKESLIKDDLVKEYVETEEDNT